VSDLDEIRDGFLILNRNLDDVLGAFFDEDGNMKEDAPDTESLAFFLHFADQDVAAIQDKLDKLQTWFDAHRE
jgi:hypothetical protein